MFTLDEPRMRGIIARMRKLILSFSIAILFAGCTYDPVSVCVNRCEQRKADGCESAGTDCENNCVLADDIYDDQYTRAENAGCVAEYNDYVACYDNTPACATITVISEMCAEEWLVLESCW